MVRYAERYGFLVVVLAGMMLAYNAAVTALSWRLPAHRRLSPSIALVDNTPVAFPPMRELSYFETEKNLANWMVKSTEPDGISVRRSLRYATQGRCSLEVRWKTDDWGYIASIDFPRNWGRYRFLAFDAVNPMSRPVKFGLRAGDNFSLDSVNPANSAFAVTGLLSPGLNRIRIPLADIGRRVRLDRAHKIIHFRLFHRGETVYLDNMRLEQ